MKEQKFDAWGIFCVNKVIDKETEQEVSNLTKTQSERLSKAIKEYKLMDQETKEVFNKLMS